MPTFSRFHLFITEWTCKAATSGFRQSAHPSECLRLIVIWLCACRGRGGVLAHSKHNPLTFSICAARLFCSCLRLTHRPLSRHSILITEWTCKAATSGFRRSALQCVTPYYRGIAAGLIGAILPSMSLRFSVLRAIHRPLSRPSILYNRMDLQSGDLRL